MQANHACTRVALDCVHYPPFEKVVEGNLIKNLSVLNTKFRTIAYEKNSRIGLPLGPKTLQAFPVIFTTLLQIFCHRLTIVSSLCPRLFL
jgi:hypothetical protein